MPVELKVPDPGESITEVQIGKWLKSEGDAVKRDEVVVEIDTDKTTLELVAPVDGVLETVKLKSGESARVGDVVGVVKEGAAPAGGGSSGGAPSKAAEVPQSALRTPEPGSLRVMPAAQRAAAQSGVDASTVEGTGPGGRVLKEDVERAAAQRGSAAPSAPAASSTPAKSAPAPSAPAGDDGRVQQSKSQSKSQRQQPSRPAPAATGGAREEEVVPMTVIRRRIAARLVEAQQNAAILTTFNEIDMSGVMALRKENQDAFVKKYGIKLGFMSFFVKAACDALRLVPEVNGEIRDDSIVYRNYCDIGVAIGGGKGLVVPVIRNAERLSFAEIEQTIADFGARAKNNRIALEELRGGTFTISNGGIYGSLLSTPILNPPQSGILGMHAIQERPVGIDGQIVLRPMMYVALSYDHRLIDGREAVTFLKRIKECIEAPARILLEV